MTPGASWPRTYQQHVATRGSGEVLAHKHLAPNLARRSEMQADAKPAAAPGDGAPDSEEPALIKDNQTSSKLECTMPVRTHTACRNHPTSACPATLVLRCGPNPRVPQGPRSPTSYECVLRTNPALCVEPIEAWRVLRA